MAYPLPDSKDLRVRGPRLGEVLRLRGWEGLYLLPFVAVAVFLLIIWMQGWGRFDAAAFSPALIERYAEPEALAADLLIAVETADRNLYADLYGLKGQVALVIDPYIRSAQPTEALLGWRRVSSEGLSPAAWAETVTAARFVTYDLFDDRGRQQFTFILEQVDGRWVVTPPDLRFAWLSGRWLGGAMVLAVAYLPVLAMAWLLYYQQLKRQYAQPEMPGTRPTRESRPLARRSSKV